MQRWLNWLTGPRSVWARIGFIWRVVALAAMSLLCLGMAGWAWWQNKTWAERANQPLVHPLANRSELGVNVSLEQYDPGRLESALTLIQESGFRWVRQRFGWDEIEPERGRFQWRTWDAIVEGCVAHDLELVAMLDGSPEWARPAADFSLAPPQEVADWGTFVTAFAERYRGKVAVYQLWDEPNLSEHWGGRYVDPVAYTALLREGTVQIRQTDPGASVLLAALAPTVENGPLNLNEMAFIQGVLKAGGRPFFDAVALQPYGFGWGPEARLAPEQLNFGRIAWVRREMVRLGLADCPVWATAWGWNSPPAGWAGEPKLWPVVDEDWQIRYTLEALQLARREWPWLGVMVLSHWQPDVSADDQRWGFALVDGQGNPRPILEEIKKYNEKKLPFYTGIYKPNSGRAEYIGDWRLSDAGADPPHGASEAERNAIVSFDWVGTTLDLTVRRGDFWGFFYVSVDGRPANALPRDESGQAYLILHDPLGEVETVTVASGLSDERIHHVEIVAHGGWGQWPLVSWTVRQELASSPGMGAVIVWLALGGVWMLGAMIQLVLTPSLARPLYAFIGQAFNRYRTLPEWVPVSVTWATALAFYFVPWTGVSLLLLAALFVLFFLRIDLGLATVALALPFYLRSKTLFGRPVSIVELGLGWCVAAWLLARLLDGGRSVMAHGIQPGLARLVAFLNEWPYRLRQVSWSKMLLRERALDIGVAALVLVAWFAVGTSFRQSVSVPHGSLLLQVAEREFRVVFLESTLFYALIRLAVRSGRAQQRLLEGWLLGTVGVSLFSLGQALTGQGLITAGSLSRVRGFYGSPNNLALYLERSLPLLLACTWQGKERWQRIAYGLAALPVAAALALTVSKGALLLGLPAGLLALGLCSRNRKAAWASVAAVVVLAAVLTPLAWTGRLGTWFDPGSGTGFFRLKLWRSTLSMVADHPLTGVGLDSFLYLYRTRYVLPSAWGELDLSHPHNLLLDTWARLGVGGLVVMGWLIVGFFRLGWSSWFDAWGNRRALLLGLLAAMAATLAHGLVDHAVFLIDLAFVFMLMLAMVQARQA